MSIEVLRPGTIRRPLSLMGTVMVMEGMAVEAEVEVDTEGQGEGMGMAGAIRMLLRHHRSILMVAHHHHQEEEVMADMAHQEGTEVKGKDKGETRMPLHRSIRTAQLGLLSLLLNRDINPLKEDIIRMDREGGIREMRAWM